MFGTILNTQNIELEIPGGSKQEKNSTEKIYDEIIVENFLNMGKEILNAKKHRECLTG